MRTRTLLRPVIAINTAQTGAVALMLALAFAFTFAALLPVHADGLAKPTGTVILTISGKVSTRNAGEKADLDRAMLAALPQQEITTSTPWFEGKTRFAGPLVKDVMALVGGSGEWATVTALDEYSVDVPVADFDAHLPILAMTRDGKAMPDDDKGPLFIIYDYDSDPKLNTDEFHSRSVWSVRSIELE